MLSRYSRTATEWRREIEIEFVLSRQIGLASWETERDFGMQGIPTATVRPQVICRTGRASRVDVTKALIQLILW